MKTIYAALLFAWALSACAEGGVESEYFERPAIWREGDTAAFVFTSIPCPNPLHGSAIAHGHTKGGARTIDFCYTIDRKAGAVSLTQPHTGEELMKVRLSDIKYTKVIDPQL